MQSILMLSVTIKPFMLSVIMLSVVMLSVMAPLGPLKAKNDRKKLVRMIFVIATRIFC